MNINTQLCGIAIILLLIYFYFRQNRLGLVREKSFLFTLIMGALCITTDAISVLMIFHSEQFAPLLVDIVSKFYLVTLVSLACVGLVYALSNTMNYAFYHKAVMVCACIGAVIDIAIFVAPISYYCDGKSLYSYGPATLITYGGAVTYILATIVFELHHGSENKKRRNAILVWMGVWIAAAAVQYFRSEWLIVGFASSLGMLFLFCTMENPENNYDRKFDCFHSHALMEYITQEYQRKHGCGVLLVSMKSKQNYNIDDNYMQDCIKKLIDFVAHDTQVRVFKSIGYELIMVFEDMSSLNRTFQQIQDRFYSDQFYMKQNFEDAMPITTFLLVPDTNAANSPVELIRLFEYHKAEHHIVDRSQVSYVNYKIFEELRQDEGIKYEIVDALAEDRVEVFFQPIYSAIQKKFISAEALVRIREKDGGYISPGRFVPIAEQSGLILQLGERVFEKTCEFISSTQALDLGLEYIEVNLSVIQCQQMNLAERYLQIMEQYHVSPYRINLEITETGSVHSKRILLDNMQRLIRKGVSFSLDDFGNGQSNLDYMIDMPVAVMKLDMNMTKAYFSDLKAKFVVQSTIKLAHDLDLFVVAEGVETEEELNAMIAEGVDDIQGYYFSKPLPGPDFLKFLRDRQ